MGYWGNYYWPTDYYPPNYNPSDVKSTCGCCATCNTWVCTYRADARWTFTLSGITGGANCLQFNRAWSLGLPLFLSPCSFDQRQVFDPTFGYFVEGSLYYDGVSTWFLDFHLAIVGVGDYLVARYSLSAALWVCAGPNTLVLQFLGYPCDATGSPPGGNWPSTVTVVKP